MGGVSDTKPDPGPRYKIIGWHKPHVFFGDAVVSRQQHAIQPNMQTNDTEGVIGSDSLLKSFLTLIFLSKTL